MTFIRGSRDFHASQMAGAIVGRAVVNKDDFEIGICLINDGGDAFGQILLNVIDGNDD